MHKLPNDQRDTILKLVKEFEEKQPTVFMLAKHLSDKTGIKNKTAREYVFLAIKEGHIVKHGFTVMAPGSKLKARKS